MVADAIACRRLVLNRSPAGTGAETRLVQVTSNDFSDNPARADAATARHRAYCRQAGRQFRKRPTAPLVFRNPKQKIGFLFTF
jgi:hypothetical protein